MIIGTTGKENGGSKARRSLFRPNLGQIMLAHLLATKTWKCYNSNKFDKDGGFPNGRNHFALCVSEFRI